MLKFAVFTLSTLSLMGCFPQVDEPVETMGSSPTPTLVRDSCDFSSFDPIQVSHFVRYALVERVVPDYPQSALQRDAQGTVSVKILVDRDGTVVKACALEGDEELGRVAEDAALKWKFKRRVEAGVHSYIQAGITFRFVLDDSDKTNANSEVLVTRPNRIDPEL